MIEQADDLELMMIDAVVDDLVEGAASKVDALAARILDSAVRDAITARKAALSTSGTTRRETSP